MGHVNLKEIYGRVKKHITGDAYTALWLHYNKKKWLT